MDASYLEKVKNVDFKNVQTFAELPLCERTQRGLRESNFVRPTAIQRQCLKPILRGLDVIAQAQTGSGKTLAYTIPILELFNQWNIRPIHGTVAIVIIPTRELAHQTLRMMNMIACRHPFTLLHVTGDKDKRSRDREWASFGNANIVISTPGRLIQHLEQNPHCQLDNVRIVVMDETDRLLDSNFEDQIQLIMSNIPTSRQLLIFSATQIRDTDRLLALNMTKAVQVSAHFESGVTPPNLKQYFITVPLQYKVSTLWTFLMTNTKRRILIFVSSQKQVRFLYNLFRELRLPMRVFELRGNMILSKRNKALEDFAKACAQLNETQNEGDNTKKGMGSIMLGTSVMERGLDFPFVDWVVQFDCPHTKTEYIHRAGRTARLEQTGQSLLFLLPSELNFLKKLRKSFQLDIERYQLEKKAAAQQKIQLCLLENNALSDMANSALLGHLNDYLEPEERPSLRKAIPFTSLKDAALGYGLPREPDLTDKLLIAYGQNPQEKPSSTSVVTSGVSRLDQLADSSSDEEHADHSVENNVESDLSNTVAAVVNEVSSETTKKTPAVETLGRLITTFTEPFKGYQTRPTQELPPIVSESLKQTNENPTEPMEVSRTREMNDEDDLSNVNGVSDKEDSNEETAISSCDEESSTQQNNDKQIYQIITSSYRTRSTKGGKKFMRLSHS